MYQIFLKLYIGFHGLFWGKEQPLIPSRGSLKEYMDYEEGDKVFDFPKNGCTYFC